MRGAKPLPVMNDDLLNKEDDGEKNNDNGQNQTGRQTDLINKFLKISQTDEKIRKTTHPSIITTPCFVEKSFQWD